MTAKEYLNQTLRLEQKINSKIAQIESLNRIASKCTSVLSETAGCSAMGTSNMSNVIAKIVDLEKELNADIEKLITLKRDVAKVIKMVSDWKYRIVLEYRYLCFYNWGDIASELNYTTKWVRTLHEKALECVDELILTKRTPVKVKIEREDVDFVMQMTKDSKMVGLTGEWSMKVKKVFSRGAELLSEKIKKGQDVRIQIISKLDDPDAYGSERLVVENAWFNELTLQKFENSKMLDEEYSGGFTDYYFPDLVKVR